MAGSDCQDALERWVHVCSASSRSQVEVTRCHICSLFTLIMRRCHFDYSARTWHWIWWVSVTLWGVSLNRQWVKQICVPRYGIMPQAFDSVIRGHYSQWSFLYLCHLLHSNHSLTLTSESGHVECDTFSMISMKGKKMMACDISPVAMFRSVPGLRIFLALRVNFTPSSYSFIIQMVMAMISFKIFIDY